MWSFSRCIRASVQFWRDRQQQLANDQAHDVGFVQCKSLGSLFEEMQLAICFFPHKHIKEVALKTSRVCLCTMNSKESAMHGTDKVYYFDFLLQQALQRDRDKLLVQHSSTRLRE